jgi:hypothetical protein
LGKTNTIKNCVGCVKAKGNTCAVLTSPSFFFDNYGHCFARSENPLFWTNLKHEVDLYAGKLGVNKRAG